MDPILSGDSDRQPGQEDGLSPAFVGAVSDRVSRNGTISAREVAAVLAAARDERALRAALDEAEEGPDLAPALTLLRERGFSRTAATVEDLVVKLRAELAEARDALVAAEAKATAEPAPLENGAFLEWWNNAGPELLVDVPVHDAALIFHAGADRVLQRRSNHLDGWMLRLAMRTALPYLDGEASAQAIAPEPPHAPSFEGAQFAAKTFRQMLGEREDLGPSAETPGATETTAEPSGTKRSAKRVQPQRRRYVLGLFPA